jgi:hypothetical protein
LKELSVDWEQPRLAGVKPRITKMLSTKHTKDMKRFGDFLSAKFLSRVFGSFVGSLGQTEPRIAQSGFAAPEGLTRDLKLVPFPTRSPLPFAALPSISLIPSARFAD